MRGARIFQAEKSGAVSKAEADQARSQIELSTAKVEDAKAQLEQARRKLGDAGRDNPAIKSAESALANAELDLSRTRVIAPGDGGVSNVIVAPGQYATAGQPLMTFVSGSTVWIEAFLRENSLEHLKEGDPVDLVLDSAPGRIFKGKVLSIGYGVDWGGTSTASQLPKVDSKKDWLRDPQRFPVAIAFDESKVTPRGKKLLREGSQVDVMIYTEKSNKVLNGIGKFWIKVVSVLSYVR